MLVHITSRSFQNSSKLQHHAPKVAIKQHWSAILELSGAAVRICIGDLDGICSNVSLAEALRLTTWYAWVLRILLGVGLQAPRAIYIPCITIIRCLRLPIA